MQDTPSKERWTIWHRLRWLRWMSAGLLLFVLLLMLFEESFIFFPSRYPEGDWQPAGLKFEDAWFTSADGTRLHGWYLPAEQPRAYVLFAHGNAGHLAHRADIVAFLQKQLRVSVLIFDYRGYGRSEGSPNEQGILADARAARTWLAERARIEPREIVLMGESIGGAVMVDLAAADGARGLILENTFTCVADVAGHHFPWLPSGMIRCRLDSAGAIGKYHSPLLMCHGDADTIVPIALGQRLYEAANEPKQMVVIHGGDHNDARTPQWLSAMDAFFESLK